MHRYTPIMTENGPRYIIEERKTIFSKWKLMKFSFLDGRTDAYLLTIAELNRVMPYKDREKSENRVIYRHLVEFLNEQERLRYTQPYHITKYRFENSRIIDTLCMAEDIKDLSDGKHTFRDLYEVIINFHSTLINSGVWKAYKTHSPYGGGYFEGGVFLVVTETPFGKFTSYYENDRERRHWNMFQCKVRNGAEIDYETFPDLLDTILYTIDKNKKS